MSLAVQVERTRLRVARGLHLALVEAGDAPAYRGAGGTPLDGEWVGAFAQPAVLLRAVTATSVTFADHGGASFDEYGEANLHVVVRDGDRVEWIKRYAIARPGAHPLRYVGRIHGSTLSGYWEAVDRPGFCGVFWLARADRLVKGSRELMQTRVRSRSVPRTVAQTVMTGLFVALGAGAVASLPLALAAALAIAAIVGIGTARVGVMKREVTDWKLLIG